MNSRKALTAVLTMAILVFALAAATVGAAPISKPTDPIGPVEVSSAVYSDVSGPVSGLTGVAPAADTDKEKREKPIRALPNMGNALDQADGVLQSAAGPLAGTTDGLNFAGVGQG